MDLISAERSSQEIRRKKATHERDKVHAEVHHSTYLIDLASQLKNEMEIVDISEECEEIEDNSHSQS